MAEEKTTGVLKLERDLVFLDTETTGADVTMDRVVQIALVRLQVDGERREFESLVNPGIPIPREAQRVHGISDTMVEYAPPFRRLLPELVEFMKDADLSGFNLIRFDIPILKNEFQRAGQTWDLEGVKMVDAQIIFHKMEPRDLSAAVRFYCGKVLEGAHGALADTRASLDVMLAQLERYPDLPRDVVALDAMFHQPDRRFVDSNRRFFWRNGEATFNFGNRRGQTLKEVAANSPGYLQWMLDSNFSVEVKSLVEDAMHGTFPSPPASPEGAAEEA